ncbi:restriction endonuclease subunit S [Aeromonas jandaei]|uniref:restriction endonuclease subunit S n=1 Tax=Aeromonas jandaei TaxID=650 RepID=UPI001C05DE00|nr:restriction endonuclease subunit S [Aeromonas jandaei]QWL66123.1 restriction endonuclease subunit S [Aeromonas jandaei]
MSELVVSEKQGLTGKYQSYPEYKDSGVEWLGQIPTHWKLRRTFHAGISIRTGKVDVNIQDDSGEFPFFTCSREAKKATQYSFDCEALLVAGNGEVGFTQYYNGKFEAYQRTYVLSDFTEYDVQFLRYHFENNLVIAVENKSIGSVIQFITLGDLRHFPLPTPPHNEQRTIAAFLDYETSRIDRLIAQQQRLIELLKEKRQAVISHAVTKGLNPTATMKDSGVEWLGQVPEHWQCVPFGLLVSRADLGGNYLGGQEENGIPFLKMGNLGRGCIVLDKLECLEEGSSFDDAHRLSMGDFLFNTRNSLDLVGKVAVWHDELEFALYNSNLLRVRFKKDFVSSPDFMGFVFNSSGALGWLALLAKGTTSVAAIYYKDFMYRTLSGKRINNTV